MSEHEKTVTDTDRLDWLQSTNETVWRVSREERRRTTETVPSYKYVEVFEGWTVDDPGSPKPTVREAIDHFINSQALLNIQTND